MMKKKSFPVSFFLSTFNLVLEAKSESYIEFHIFYLHSVWSHYFAKNYVDRAPLIAA